MGESISGRPNLLQLPQVDSTFKETEHPRVFVKGNPFSQRFLSVWIFESKYPRLCLKWRGYSYDDKKELVRIQINRDLQVQEGNQRARRTAGLCPSSTIC